ncbi:hypothetical protein CCR85_14640 [Rhodothalassium salexigens]|uniref:EAL domain-containing protein n=1 Tax=Rhodothalassium salexigens TaxID=1086 RepID=UPI0019146DD6|nr:cyclic diguanylate phosphodiesterase [Rhodothalassium salexigens]MBK5912718.1 hypothetical protein [Rhodothalassium salexigens]MBK5920625.1 hypothetical protein [Rhodothalassium salexigens]
MHRRLFVIASTVLVMLVAASLALALGYALSVRQSHRAVEGYARGTLEDSEAVVGYAIREIGSLAALAGQPCDAWSTESLSLQSYLSPFVRQFGIIDDQGNVYCTNFGAARIPSPIEMMQAFERDGVFMTVSDTEVRQRRSLVIAVPMTGGGAINGLVAPDEFAHPSVVRHLGRFGHASLLLDDGSEIVVAKGGAAHPDGSWNTRQSADRGIVKSVRSDDYPFRAVVRADPGFVLRMFKNNLPLIAPLALLLGASLGLLFYRQTTRQMSLEQSLRRSVARDCQDFRIHYQPIIELETDRCVGVEALIRWQHPSMGMIRPDRFIPIAERNGLIVPLTRWLIRTAIDELAPQLYGDPKFHVGVNLAATHFRTFDLVDDLRQLVAYTSLRPSQITLESTEREILSDYDQTPLRVMEMLSAQGFSIAIDDFGTGHNGLAFLQRFPAQILKVDRTFVDTIGTDAVKRPVLDAIVDLGQRLTMGIIAEGVETPEQAAYLRAMGVPYAQGFFFARPMPVADLNAYLEDLEQSLREAAMAKSDNVRRLFGTETPPAAGGITP